MALLWNSPPGRLASLAPTTASDGRKASHSHSPASSFVTSFGHSPESLLMDYCFVDGSNFSYSDIDLEHVDEDDAIEEGSHRESASASPMSNHQSEHTFDVANAFSIPGQFAVEQMPYLSSQNATANLLPYSGQYQSGHSPLPLHPGSQDAHQSRAQDSSPIHMPRQYMAQRSFSSSNTFNMAHYPPDPWNAIGEHRSPGVAPSSTVLFGPRSDPFIPTYAHANPMGSPSEHNLAATPSSSNSPLMTYPNLKADASLNPSPAVSMANDFSHSFPSEYGGNAFDFSNPSFQYQIHSHEHLQTPSIQTDNSYDFETPLDNQLDSAYSERSASLTGASEIKASPGPSCQPSAFVEQVFAVQSRPSDRAIQKRASRRAGGRQVGSHLNPDTAARTKLMREHGSCWLCCLQRDKCTPGEVCQRCSKRNSRPQQDHGLGCDRTKLTDLKDTFLPDFLTVQHLPKALLDFTDKHIRSWLSVSIKVKLTLIWGLPTVDLEMYEFEPKTGELERQFQYVLNPKTGKNERICKTSPPLGMMMIENTDKRRYDKFLNDVVDRHMDHFIKRCYGYESDDFQLRLLQLLAGYKPQEKDEIELLRQIFRLQVVTYIMCRTATIPNADREYILSKMRSYRRGTYSTACSPRMANRQLKYLCCSLQQQIMNDILKRLQQILRSSKGNGKWTSAFCAILGLAMVHEETQKIIHVDMDALHAMGQISRADADRKAESACREIDDRFGFVANLFRWKYNRSFTHNKSFNPLRDAGDPRMVGILGERNMGFVGKVTELILEKCRTPDNYLNERQHVGISTENKEKYTSRLVSRFLLSFWRP
ncbi:hypothetical protein K402DRAFT_396850 [Aulographum hederae CBS 113979]|uniref:Zn(2)-C6 fungal-type domain-containing protein n=1 Tax=Aulographum hederae CBS 113979 TaxID=1176131 RepID=A0A6G1GQA6_9PEZI|nr:hypothetical protein K402DRAFT_396850 [Aulographum hederae CBS 113979]